MRKKEEKLHDDIDYAEKCTFDAQNGLLAATYYAYSGQILN